LTLIFSAHFVLEHYPILLSKAAERRGVGSMSAERIVEITSPPLRNKATPDEKWSTSHLAR
jgi:hypothetical protein